ncbi:Uncharacterized membrane protein YcaP, DUF421 family [Alteribacillus iranensis]|uniref:Uncharacterized membrane protein YcaP, DUF421 family n=1 Tax=Alteribacillus iranensis TaxID=930128 RepID=A0A1I1ZLU7_9BACI|nr:DUF421 domain-containing protein [Alteribacillus iranensis]SFE32676.1 Uncharacterized membrane protein YcaP, DUF421 family [Alteribacillus iranensis]
MPFNFLHLTLELIVGFVALLFITKALGKTQISQITPFDFISALILGELVGNAIYDKEIGIHYVLYAVILWALLIIIIEKITQKKKASRSFLEGRPTIVIREGKIDYEALRHNKLDLNQLQHLLRDKDVFSFQDVHYAILEANGTVNVMKTPSSSPTTNKDWMAAVPAPSPMPLSVILDGEWIEDNINEANLNKGDILADIHDQNIPALEKVLYAEWNGSYPLYIQTYETK